MIDASSAHPVTDTVLLFRPHRPDETVGERDMLVVRRQLVDNGLIEASGFRTLPAAGDSLIHEMGELAMHQSVPDRFAIA